MRVSVGAVIVAMQILAGYGAAAGPSTGVVSPELFDTASARGAVRVLVQLKVVNGADPATIDAAKLALWSDLVGTTYRVVRDLAGFPVVAIEASPETLRALASSTHVEHVAADEIRRPLR